MAYLVDSSVLISVERRSLALSRLLEVPEEASALASVTVAELLFGVYRSNTPERRTRRAAFVQSILDAFPVFPFDSRIAERYAEIWVALRTSGQMIDTHDLMIAATALAHGYEVLTENVRHFDRVPGLVVNRPDW